MPKHLFLNIKNRSLNLLWVNLIIGRPSSAKKNAGDTSLLINISSLAKRKCSERPGIFHRKCSITVALKQGRHTGGIISLWSTTLTLGFEVSNHFGVWLSVTINILRIQGAYCSIERKLYFSSSLSAYLPLQFTADLASILPIQALCFSNHCGSLPSTQRYTKSISISMLNILNCVYLFSSKPVTPRTDK